CDRHGPVELPHSLPTRRSSDLHVRAHGRGPAHRQLGGLPRGCRLPHPRPSLAARGHGRSRPRAGWQAPSRPRLTPPGGEPLMSETVKMPALGESVTEGTVTRWLKSVGETIDV